jgi:hypothetical protein
MSLADLGNLFSKPGWIWRSVGTVTPGFSQLESTSTFFRIERTSKEIGYISTIRTIEADIFHELLCHLGWSIVYLLSFIKHEDFVELIKDSIAGLIEGDDRSQSEDISHRSDSLDVLKGSGRIETSCRIIPTVDASASCHCFDDADTFTLTATNTSNEGVANFR